MIRGTGVLEALPLSPDVASAGRALTKVQHHLDVLAHWSYYSLALSHRFLLRSFFFAFLITSTMASRILFAMTDKIHQAKLGHHCAYRRSSSSDHQQAITAKIDMYPSKSPCQLFRVNCVHRMTSFKMAEISSVDSFQLHHQITWLLLKEMIDK